MKLTNGALLLHQAFIVWHGLKSASNVRIHGFLKLQGRGWWVLTFRGAKVMYQHGVKQGRGPIFVVGSPRSGTSVLTWCLGQHANILPQEESAWMGEFAISVGVQFQVGSLHGERSQLSALGIESAAFFRAFGDGIDRMILQHRDRQEQASRECARRDSSQVDAAFNISRSNSDPKSRWVDGTPEYAYYIAGLRKLFPDAKFVHIARDVRSVVNSMLHFKLHGNRNLVDTEQQAYEYWISAVQACMQAEHAYGPEVVHRLRYEDLIQGSEWAIKGVLDFLGEPYMEACLEPLARRINSSCVPVGFESSDPRTDPKVIDRAMRLSRQLQRSNRAFSISKDELVQAETDFSKRVSLMAGLDADYSLGQRKVATLTRRLNWCGVIMAADLLMATAVLSKPLQIVRHSVSVGSALWLASSVIGAAVYIAMRRKGLRAIAAWVFRRCALKRDSGRVDEKWTPAA